MYLSVANVMLKKEKEECKIIRVNTFIILMLVFINSKCYRLRSQFEL